MYVVHVCVSSACMLTYVFGGGCGACICYGACMHTSFWWCTCVNVVHACVDGVYIHIDVFGGACGAHVCMWCMYVNMVHVYTHIDLILFVSMKSGTLFMKSDISHEKHMKSTWKATKTSDSTQISHFDPVFHRVQREGQLGLSYILVVFGGTCGACMCEWYMYTHILTWFCLFSWKMAHFVWKVALFMKSTWKALKSTWKKTPANSTHICHLDLVFYRVQREGQLGISYILVVFCGACGAYMCKWYMYTCILTWFCWFLWKVVLFVWKLAFFVESTWKALKSKKKKKNLADSRQIYHFVLVFCRVQREGQLGISYILVEFGGACVASMCKWYTYTHILTWFCWFHEKWCFLNENWHFVWKAHEKLWNTKNKNPADSTQISHLSWCFREYREKAS